MAFKAQAKKFLVVGKDVIIDVNRKSYSGKVVQIDFNVINDASVILETNDELVLLPINANTPITVDKTNIKEGIEIKDNENEKSYEFWDLIKLNSECKDRNIQIPRNVTKRQMVNLLNNDDREKELKLRKQRKLEKKKKKKKDRS